MIERYEDFDILVTSKDGRLYVALGSVPSDHATVQLVPVTVPRERALWLEMRHDHTSVEELAEIGHQLFDIFLAGEIASHWNARLNRARRRSDTGLRLRFSLPPDQMDGLPLELLCSRTTPIVEFLALDTLTPIVRSLHYGGTVQERLVTVPLRMLIVASLNDMDAVRGVWEEALAELTESKRLILEFLSLSGNRDADDEAWYRRLVHTTSPYDIVHVVGDADLLLTQNPDAREKARHIPGWANLLAYNGVRIVTLQTWAGTDGDVPGGFRDVARQLVARGLPAVMTTRRPLDDNVATAFYRQVYTVWLQDGGVPVEYAVSEARRALYRQWGERSPWWEPILFVRRGSGPLPRVEQETQPFNIYLKRAAVLSERGQSDQAVVELEMAYQVAPGQVYLPLAWALVAQARTLEDRGDEDGALAACERALKVFPAEQTAREIITSIWLRRGDRALARRDLADALRAYRQAGDRLKVEEVEARERSRQAARRQIEVEGVSIPTAPAAVTEIERCVEQGQEYLTSSEWQAALAAFERGLELYHPYGELVGPLDELGPLFRQLKLGQLHAQAMLHLSEKQWDAAIGVLGILAQHDLDVVDIDVEARLAQARSEQRFERRYAHLLVLVEQENWVEAIRLAETLDPAYEGPDGQRVIDILKRVLYTWGRELEGEDSGRAYYLLYELYQLDSSYEDVANRCATIAFRNGTRRDIFTDWGQKVEWLERVVEIDPYHRSGRTRRALNDARYHWAEALLETDRAAAVAQLERIDPSYEQSVEVRQILADIYNQFLQEGVYVRSEQANLDAEAEARARLGIALWEQGDRAKAVEQLEAIPAQAEVFPSILALARVYVALGHEARQARRWQNALEWWQRAMRISPSLAESLRWRIREARARLWIRRHKWETIGAGAVFLLLLVALAVLGSQGVIRLPARSPTATPTVTVVSTPTSVTEPPSSPTPLALPADQATRIPTATRRTAAPIPTTTPTPTPTQTATRTPGPTRPLLSPTPGVVQPRQSSPALGANITRVSQVTLEWEGSLGGNQAFRVVLYHVNTGYTIQSPDLRISTWTTGLPAERYGEYRWQVVVVQGDTVLTRTDEWHFWFDPIGGSPGGGEDGGPTPSGGQTTPTEPPVVDPTEPPP